MLLPSYFIIDINKQESLPDILLPENAFVCYRITDVLSSDPGSFYQKLLLSYTKYRFCALVDIDNAKAKFEDIIDSLVSCTFFYNYIKLNFENPLVIFETEKEDIGSYILAARKIFRDHGYNEMDTILLNNHAFTGLAGNSEKGRYFKFSLANNSISAYPNSIKEMASANSSCFFYLNHPNELSEMLSRIDQYDKHIQIHHPQIYRLLAAYTYWKKKEQIMSFKIGLTKEQLKSASNYRKYYDGADTRYKTQVTELLRFYKNEYEILPKWYKQFGHIIKVITGKRTFKSLFNDNVKKYKN